MTKVLKKSSNKCFSSTSKWTDIDKIFMMRKQVNWINRICNNYFRIILTNKFNKNVSNFKNWQFRINL